MAERDRIRADLEERGIGTAIHYPIPIHRMGAFEHLGYGPGAFPMAETVCSEIISLPLFPELSEEQVVSVCTNLQEVAAERQAHRLSAG